VTVIDELPIPEEPLRLRASVRKLVAEDPQAAETKLSDGEWITRRLWQAWGPELRGRGMPRREFREVVQGYRRELWLWVAGERTWRQCAEGLEGRTRRRLIRS
jgi:hypothetical protein